jgi:putative transposase
VLASAQRWFRATTDSTHQEPVASNLVARTFELAHHAHVDRTWIADITYIPRRRLAPSRGPLGPRLAPRRGVGARNAPDSGAHLERASNGTAAPQRPRWVQHSDRGLQYAIALTSSCLRTGCTPSISRMGDCWDSSVAESFVATLTK